MSGLRLYLRYLGVSIRGQMQYAGSFVLAAIGQFLITAIEAVGIWALFQRFGQIHSWQLAEVAFFYGTVQTAFSLADALSTGFDQFGTLMVRTGDFDRLLLRPRSSLLQLAGQELALKRVGRLAQALLVLGWASAALQLSWSAGKLALLGATLFAGVCLFCGVIVLQATLSFWTTESLEIMNTLSYGGSDAARYPLSIYERWFRRFFTFVIPLACVTYFPLLALLGIDDPLGSPRWLQLLAPLAGPAFLALSLWAFGLGVRRYTSVGS